MADSSNHPQPGDVLVMVGTRKGTFLFWSASSVAPLIAAAWLS